LPSAPDVDADDQASEGGLGAIYAPACVLNGIGRPSVASALTSASIEVRQTGRSKKSRKFVFAADYRTVKQLRLLMFFKAVNFRRPHRFSRGFSAAWLAPIAVAGLLTSGEITIVETFFHREPNTHRIHPT
jgi:hypothetical protein